MATSPRVHGDGSLTVSLSVTVPAEEIEVRVTTSGGPGGQHANRSLTRVVVTFRVLESTVLTASQQQRVLERVGTVVRSSASRHRSQRQNRTAALEQLGEKLANALASPRTRRPTTPTKGAQVRRVDDKKARGRLKEQRRRVSED